MNYIVGLTGTHGTGKSTILQGVKAAGFPVVETSLSRAAQAALGWDKLSRADESFANVWALQNAVLEAMYDRDLEITKSKQFTLVERTPADVWAYMCMWSKRHALDLRHPQVVEYKAKCRELASKYELFLQVPMTDAVPFVAEANRADLESREDVARDIDDFIWSGGLPMMTVSPSGKEDRIALAVSAMTILNARYGQA